MAYTLEQLLAHPSYQRLDPEQKAAARQRYFDKYVASREEFVEMSPGGQARLHRQIVNLDRSRTLAERAGFTGEPGPVESLTGKEAGQIFDLPLKVLDAPGSLVGSVVEDVSGSAGLGFAANLATGISLPSIGAKIARKLFTKAAPAAAASAAGAAEAPGLEGAGGLLRDLISKEEISRRTGKDVLTGGARSESLSPMARTFARPDAAGAARTPPEGNAELGNRLRQYMAGEVPARPVVPREHYAGQLGGARRAAAQAFEDAKAGPGGAYMPSGGLSRRPPAKTLRPDEGATWGGSSLKDAIDLTGEAGFFTPMRGVVLAGAAAGGLLGAVEGQTTAEHVKNALIGAGIGAAAAGGLVAAAKNFKPVIAGLGGAAVGTESGGVRTINAAGKAIAEYTAAPGHVAAATAERISRRRFLPRDVAEAVSDIDSGPLVPTKVPLGFLIKTTLEKGTPRVIGFPAHDAARGIPAFENLVERVYASADDARAVESWFVRAFNDAYAPLRGDRAAIARVNTFLDTGKGALSDVEQAVAANSRAVLVKGADVTGMPPAERLLDYFFRLRDRVRAVAEGGMEITLPDGTKRFARTLVRLSDDADYVPVYLEGLVPKQYKAIFEHTRKLPAFPATDLGIEPLLAYARGVGRAVALRGGTHPGDGRQIPGALADIRAGLAQLPDHPTLNEYAAQWINDTLGFVSRNVSRGEEEMVHRIKRLQFLRTIALNPLSAALNLTQSLNTLAKVSLKSWVGGVSDLLDPAKRTLAAQYGVGADLAKADLDLLASANAVIGDRLAEAGIRKLGVLFNKSEGLVRNHAFMAGLREASARGLSGEQSVAFARKLVDQTQFRFGREALPATFREPGITQVISQFKTYPINQGLFLKNLIVDDAKNAWKSTKAAYAGDWSNVDGLPMAGTVKWFGTVIGLFGSDAALLGLDKSISKAITGNEETLRVKGFFPALGLHLANQVGLGAMPVDDLRSLMFFLPGPAAAQALDAVSVGSYLLGTGGSAAPYGRNFALGPGFGEPMSAEQLAGKMTRMVPLAGIMMNRLRRALVEVQSVGGLREPATLGQAFGAERMTGNERLLDRAQPSLGGGIRTVLGAMAPERSAERDRGREAIDLITARNDVVSRAAQLVAIGKRPQAQALLAQFEQEHGVRARLTPQSIRNALRAARVPREELRERRAPRELRALLRQRRRPKLGEEER